ncbi:MAG: hypothetical protein OXG44_21260 [Gammaproteobacteria bacterium]|nr:hypothetical protein [Gammaproteobacteria bacterium]
MNLDWTAIRPLHGSQAAGFEELCAQLARTESPAGAKFERKGTPDAGVECFCALSDNTEWGWQAKYFTTLGDSQFAQLDGSVKTALSRHSSLTRYFVCVPLDRPDARVDGKKSAMERWNERVSKWERWARESSRHVDFVWWGSSELIERLARTEHVGRVFFWFGQRGFDQSWFDARLREALDSAGPRYTPPVHVDLPLAKDLECFGRTASSIDAVKAQAIPLRKALQTLNAPVPDRDDPSCNLPAEDLLHSVNAVLEGFAALSPDPIGELPLQTSTPILQPEFWNPLFLKTICQGLRDDGRRRLPRGLHGITAAFDLYLRTQDKRLAADLGYNPRDRLVRKALRRLAQLVLTHGKRWLPRAEASALVDELLPGREYERSLYRGLVSEGLLVEDIPRFSNNWTGRGADSADRESKLAAFDPTAHEDGPTALLARDDLLRRYLNESDMALCWTVLGEKRIIGREANWHYQGALHVSGAYTLRDDGPDGFLRSRRDRLDQEHETGTPDAATSGRTPQEIPSSADSPAPESTAGGTAEAEGTET